MAKTTKQLKTGNADAAKPGKAVTYVVTQETFDVAFKAGHAVGIAFHDAAEALKPLLYPLSARTDDVSVKQWNEYRRAFCMGMAAARNIDPDSARRMFGRVVDYLNLDKPQTQKALAEQKRRAANKGENEQDSDASPVDGAGAAAAEAVKMELSKIEAHIISLLRAGKHEMAAQCIADMADAK